MSPMGSVANPLFTSASLHLSVLRGSYLPQNRQMPQTYVQPDYNKPRLIFSNIPVFID